jgi:hypothetical protein
LLLLKQEAIGVTNLFSAKRIADVHWRIFCYNAGNETMPVNQNEGRSLHRPLKTTISVLAMLLLAVVLGVLRNRAAIPGKESGITAFGKYPVTPSTRPSSTSSVASKTTLSRSEIIAQLPAVPPNFGSPFISQGQREKLDIYRQLGVVDGEASIDYLFSTISNKQSSVFAMTAALTGWMETDMEAALVAFQKLNEVTPGSPPSLQHGELPLPGSLFEWRGEHFHSGMV